jgi:hypothetical protein
LPPAGRSSPRTFETRSQLPLPWFLTTVTTPVPCSWQPLPPPAPDAWFVVGRSGAHMEGHNAADRGHNTADRGHNAADRGHNRSMIDGPITAPTHVRAGWEGRGHRQWGRGGGGRRGRKGGGKLDAPHSQTIPPHQSRPCAAPRVLEPAPQSNPRPRARDAGSATYERKRNK